jgi:hypothetical protein
VFPVCGLELMKTLQRRNFEREIRGKSAATSEQGSVGMSFDQVLWRAKKEPAELREVLSFTWRTLYLSDAYADSGATDCAGV